MRGQLPVQRQVPRRIHDINAAAQHGDRMSACRQGAGCRHAVTTQRHARYGHGACCRQLIAYFIRHAFAVFAHGARPDDADAQAPGKVRQSAEAVEQDGWIKQCPQAGRVLGVPPEQEADACLFAVAFDAVCLVQALVAQRSPQSFAAGELLQLGGVGIEQLVGRLIGIQHSRKLPAGNSDPECEPDIKQSVLWHNAVSFRFSGKR